MSRAKAFALGRRGGMTEYSRGIPAVVVTDNPRCSNQSLCFGLKRRSDRTHASIRGLYGNRGCAAPEICDDGKPVRSIPTMPPAVRFLSSGERNRRKKAAKGTFVVANLAGIVFPVSERAGKTRKCSIAPPLHPEALGFGVIMNGIGGFPHWILLPRDEGRELCTVEKESKSARSTDRTLEYSV